DQPFHIVPSSAVEPISTFQIELRSPHSIKSYLSRKLSSTHQEIMARSSYLNDDQFQLASEKKERRGKKRNKKGKKLGAYSWFLFHIKALQNPSWLYQAQIHGEEQGTEAMALDSEDFPIQSRMKLYLNGGPCGAAPHFTGSRHLLLALPLGPLKHC
ncbi:hypothetical protein STEG23_005358, partial [Scotinomys teguina]